MERLTRKKTVEEIPKGFGGKYYIFTDEFLFGENYVSPTDKLGAFEDLEEELGIDLITLFKALKEGIYYLEEENIFFSNDVNLWCGTSKNYYISGAGIYKKVKDYGKTWWLEKPKEELEND